MKMYRISTVHCHLYILSSLDSKSHRWVLRCPAIDAFTRITGSITSNRFVFGSVGNSSLVARLGSMKLCSTGGVGMVGHTPYLDVIDVRDCRSPRHLILMWRKIPCKKASQTASRTSLLVSLQKQTAKDMHKKEIFESYPLHLVHPLQTPEGLNHCPRDIDMLSYYREKTC